VTKPQASDPSIEDIRALVNAGKVRAALDALERSRRSALERRDLVALEDALVLARTLPKRARAEATTADAKALVRAIQRNIKYVKTVPAAQRNITNVTTVPAMETWAEAKARARAKAAKGRAARIEGNRERQAWAEEEEARQGAVTLFKYSSMPSAYFSASSCS
jgi:hypothetical protein